MATVKGLTIPGPSGAMLTLARPAARIFHTHPQGFLASPGHMRLVLLLLVVITMVDTTMVDSTMVDLAMVDITMVDITMVDLIMVDLTMVDSIMVVIPMVDPAMVDLTMGILVAQIMDTTTVTTMELDHQPAEEQNV